MPMISHFGNMRKRDQVDSSAELELEQKEKMTEIVDFKAERARKPKKNKEQYKW